MPAKPGLTEPRSQPEYPILVREWKGNQSMQIVCESCGAEAFLTGDTIRNEGFYNCPKDCGGSATYKYEQADECPGCKKLGFFHRGALDGCCSRACKLQRDYAKDLTRG